MKTEENKRMLALSCIVADLKAENMELEQRLQHLENDYADVLTQLHDKNKRNSKDQSKQTLDDMQHLRDHCDHPERLNKKLERFAKAMHEFVIEKNLYMKKDNECPYRHGCIHVGSSRCMGCNSCYSVIKGHGVICEKRLKDANVSLPDNE